MQLISLFLKKKHYNCNVLKLINDMKVLSYVAISLIVILAASCTFAVYVQKNNTDSTQKVENPTSASADSASITIQSPVK